MISQIEKFISVFGALAMCRVRIIAWRFVTVRATTVRQFACTHTARERALRESEHRFQGFAASASDWMWEMNKEFKFTYFSDVNSQPRLLKLIGKTRWAVAGIAHEADERWGKHKRVLEAREPFRDSAKCYRASYSNLRHVVSSGRPIFDENSLFPGYRGPGLRRHRTKTH